MFIMNNSTSNLIKNVFIYGSSEAIVKLIAFLTIPVYTRIFSPEEYGALTFIITLVGLLGLLLGFGCETTYTRFFFDSESIEDKRTVTTTWFVFIFMWTGIIIILLITYSKLISLTSFGTPEYELSVFIALLNIPIDTINKLCAQTLRNLNRIYMFSILNIISTILVVAFGILGVLLFNLGIIAILGGILISSLIVLPFRLFLIMDCFHFKFSFSVLHQLIKFGLPLVPMAMAYWIFNVSDRIMIGKLSTFEQVGLYSVGSSFTNIIALVSVAIGHAWTPIAFDIYARDKNLAAKFYGQVLSQILIFYSIISVGLTIFSKDIICLMTSAQFYNSWIIIGPLCIGLMASISTQITALGISLKKKPHYLATCSWAAALLNFLLNYILIPKWGFFAASITTAASYIFLTIIYSFISNQLFSINYNKTKILKVSIFTILFVSGAYYLPGVNSKILFFTKISYFIAFISLLFHFQILNLEELRLHLSHFKNSFCPLNQSNYFNIFRHKTYKTQKQ